eukprot:m.163940 g.163940  ORF g.163940 m.163940 type:complete len:322 (+) comp15221_c0_seq7:134-1099(+)
MAEHALQQLRLDEKAQEEVSVEKQQENEASALVAPQEEGTTPTPLATAAACAQAQCDHPPLGPGPCACVRIKTLKLKQKSAEGLSPEEETEFAELAEPLWVSEQMLRVRRNDPTLKELRLGGRGLTSAQVLDLFTALVQNTSVKRLILGAIQIDEPAAAVLCHVIKVNTTLAKLNIHGAKLSRPSAEQLHEALKSNNTLKTLGTDNGFVDTAFQILRARNNDPSLHRLALRCTYPASHYGLCCDLNDALMCDIAEALKANTYVTKLSAETGSLGVQGTQALAMLIRSNNTLTSLIMSKCSFVRNAELHAVLKACGDWDRCA